MPLYEYECARCGRFERIQKFSDPPLLACPTCGGEVQKLLSAPAIQFKGTGWYITDYARKSGGGVGLQGGRPGGQVAQLRIGEQGRRAPDPVEVGAQGAGRRSRLR